MTPTESATDEYLNKLLNKPDEEMLAGVDIDAVNKRKAHLMVYSPKVVANAFLWKKARAGLIHMKLQKLVFFMHAWSLAQRNKSVVSEKPAPWQYGPVFASLYHELKSFGSKDVATYLEEFNPETGQMAALVPNSQDAYFWSLFDRVWDRYGQLSAIELSALTHEQNGAWERARTNLNAVIPDDDLANYYRQKLTASA